MNEEIRELNAEIFELEETFVDEKLNLEKTRAELWLETDFQAILGKGKPTQKDKESWVKIETYPLEENCKHLENLIKVKKRLFEVMLNELGDEK